VVLTFRDALAWLAVETPCCLIVHRPTLTAMDLALLRTHRLWAQQLPLLVVTSVPAPPTLQHALAESACVVVPLFVSPDVLCQMVMTLTTSQEDKL
jgi:hypothetical protein